MKVSCTCYKDANNRITQQILKGSLLESQGIDVNMKCGRKL